MGGFGVSGNLKLGDKEGLTENMALEEISEGGDKGCCAVFLGVGWEWRLIRQRKG